MRLPHKMFLKLQIAISVFYDMKARWRTDAVEWDASVLDSLNHLQYYKDTRWTVCSPETAGNFSAVAYYFGKKLQDSCKFL